MWIMWYPQVNENSNHEIPEGRIEREGAERLFKEIIAENFPNFGSDNDIQGSPKDPKRDQPKENYSETHYN